MAKLTGRPGVIQTRCRGTSIPGELQLNAFKVKPLYGYVPLLVAMPSCTRGLDMSKLLLAAFKTRVDKSGNPG
jgi:hypothetical protein